MTNHDMLTEGSHRTFAKVWRDAQDSRLDDLERKAERKARHAGVEHAVLRVRTLTERLMLEGRGWVLESTEVRAMGTTSRFVLRRSLTSDR